MSSCNRRQSEMASVPIVRQAVAKQHARPCVCSVHCEQLDCRAYFWTILLGRVEAIEPKLLDCYLRQFAATDEVGSPSHVASYGLSHTLSCKTIQQLWDIASIVQLLGHWPGHALNCQCAHIIEIGGGYGGLAKNLIGVVRPDSLIVGTDHMRVHEEWPPAA